jgi:hypothetical protein
VEQACGPTHRDRFYRRRNLCYRSLLFKMTMPAGAFGCGRIEGLLTEKSRRIDYIFLKRFSKAWRASVGRDGDGGGDVAVEG